MGQEWNEGGRSREYAMKPNNDIVSIVIPAYRAANYVSEAIRSVQAQDMTGWEMLVVDDGSPDNTATIVASYAASDSRIKLIIS